MPLDSKWVAFAQNDLLTAQVLLREGIWNQVCFHSQQAVEKLLKASLPAESRPRSHKIADLLRRTDFLDLSVELKAELRLMDRFYIPSRYPDALPGPLEEGMPSEEDARRSLKAAKLLQTTLAASGY